MTRHTHRAASGKFQKKLSYKVTPARRDSWAMVVAAVVAVSMAILLARCHMVWSGGTVVMPCELPRDLLSPLE